MAYERYFDHAATTPILPEVAERLSQTWKSLFGNANSIHEPGRAAREAVEWARARVADLIGAEDPSEVVFTSGATEANNWVLANFEMLAVSPFEHSSVCIPALDRGAELLRSRGWQVMSSGGDAELISVMSVNNETGAILELPDIDEGVLVHRDITQQVGKLPVDLAGVDFASFSGHKFGGLKGVGGLYLRGGGGLDPLLSGGGQEHGLRSGTVNVPGVYSMGVAADIALQNIHGRFDIVRQCREAVLDGVRPILARPVIEGSPYILSLTLPGVEGESMVIELDRLGFAVSAGAACSSESTEPSQVLASAGYSESEIRSTIRVSFGWSSTPADSSELGLAIREVADRLVGLAPGQTRV